MELTLATILLLLASVFLLNVNPLFTIPTWIVVSLVIGKGNVVAAMPIIAAAVATSAIGRYILARYSGSLADKFLPQKQKGSLKFIKRFMSGETSVVWPFIVAFLYALSPLPTNALFIVAGAARLGLLALLSGFFVGEFLSNIAYISILEASLSIEQYLIFGIVGLAIAIGIFLVDWKKVIKYLMEREMERRAHEAVREMYK